MKRLTVASGVGLAAVLLVAFPSAGCSDRSDRPELAPRSPSTQGASETSGLPAQDGSDRPAADRSDSAPPEDAPGGPTAEEDGSAPAPEFIPVEGANEEAALDAVPAALAQAAEMKATGGLPPVPDLAGLAPKLEAYLLRGEAGTRIVLFQIGADGKARELYGAAEDPNPASLMVQDSSVVGLAPSTPPASEGEKKAAAAVREIMELAFPGEEIGVVITGYRFRWETDPIAPYRLEIAPDGSVISTS